MPSRAFSTRTVKPLKAAVGGEGGGRDGAKGNHNDDQRKRKQTQLDAPHIPKSERMGAETPYKDEVGGAHTQKKHHPLSLHSRMKEERRQEADVR